MNDSTLPHVPVYWFAPNNDVFYRFSYRDTFAKDVLDEEELKRLTKLGLGDSDIFEFAQKEIIREYGDGLPFLTLKSTKIPLYDTLSDMTVAEILPRLTMAVAAVDYDAIDKWHHIFDTVREYL